MRLPSIETLSHRLILFDINNLIAVRDNPKITIVFAAAGALIVAKLVTLSVLVPFNYLAVFFGILIAIPVIYLLRCLANNPQSVKRAFCDYNHMNVDKKHLASPSFSLLHKAFAIF